MLGRTSYAWCNQLFSWHAHCQCFVLHTAEGCDLITVLFTIHCTFLVQLHHLHFLIHPLLLHLLFPPSILQPVLHSCCSNPLSQLPALHSVDSLPSSFFFTPFSLSLLPFPVSLHSSCLCNIIHIFLPSHLLRRSFSVSLLCSCLSLSLSLFSFFLIREPLRSPFSRSRQLMPRLRLMKHCQALPTRLCVCVRVRVCVLFFSLGKQWMSRMSSSQAEGFRAVRRELLACPWIVCVCRQLSSAIKGSWNARSIISGGFDDQPSSLLLSRVQWKEYVNVAGRQGREDEGQGKEREECCSRHGGWGET